MQRRSWHNSSCWPSIKSQPGQFQRYSLPHSGGTFGGNLYGGGAKLSDSYHGLSVLVVGVTPCIITLQLFLNSYQFTTHWNLLNILKVIKYGNL